MGKISDGYTQEIRPKAVKNSVKTKNMLMAARRAAALVDESGLK